MGAAELVFHIDTLLQAVSHSDTTNADISQKIQNLRDPPPLGGEIKIKGFKV